MKPDDIVRYADRIYGYAVKRTFSRDEADELSQEILCAAIRSQPAGTTAGKAALRARRILCAGRVKPGPAAQAPKAPVRRAVWKKRYVNLHFMSYFRIYLQILLTISQNLCIIQARYNMLQAKQQRVYK